MRKLRHVLIALLMLATGLPARADLDADKEQLRDLEMRCAVALVEGNVQWLASFYDEDWILIGSDGQRFTRKKTLAQLASGALKWRSCVMSEWDIRVFGDTAIVIYKATLLGEVQGAKIEETELCTDSFVRVGDQWRCVHSHNIKLP